MGTQTLLVYPAVTHLTGHRKRQLAQPQPLDGELHHLLFLRSWSHLGDP